MYMMFPIVNTCTCTLKKVRKLFNFRYQMEDSDNESMTEITNIICETHQATEAEQDVKSETDESHLNQVPKGELELCSRKGESMSQSEVEESNPQTGSQPKRNLSHQTEVQVSREDHHFMQDCDKYNPDSSISEQHNDWINDRQATLSIDNLTHRFPKAREVFPKADIQSDSLYGTPTCVTEYGSIFVQFTGNLVFLLLDPKPIKMLQSE